MCVSRRERVRGRRRPGVPVRERPLREHRRLVPLRLPEGLRHVAQDQPLRRRLDRTGPASARRPVQELGHSVEHLTGFYKSGHDRQTRPKQVKMYWTEVLCTKKSKARLGRPVPGVAPTH